LPDRGCFDLFQLCPRGSAENAIPSPHLSLCLRRARNVFPSVATSQLDSNLQISILLLLFPVFREILRIRFGILFVFLSFQSFLSLLQSRFLLFPPFLTAGKRDFWFPLFFTPPPPRLRPSPVSLEANRFYDPSHLPSLNLIPQCTFLPTAKPKQTCNLNRRITPPAPPDPPPLQPTTPRV